MTTWAKVGLGAALITVLSCGGGGGGISQASTIKREDTFTVSSGGSMKIFGEIGVEVSAGSFAASTSITARQFTGSPYRPTNPNAKPTHVVELESSHVPSQDLTVTAPAGQVPFAALYDGERVTALRITKAGGKVRVTVPSSGGQGGESPGIVRKWKIIIGGIDDLLPERETKLVHISGGTDFGAPGTILYVHGIFDDAEDMKDISERLSPDLGGTNIFSLAYNFYGDTPSIATDYGAILDQARNRGKNITIVAHSRGGLISRYTLERRGKTHAVKKLITLATPHEGSAAADAVDLALALCTEYLNNKGKHSPFELLQQSPILTEMRSGSSFLAGLNDPQQSQRGVVDYVLLAGSSDFIVPSASAQAKNILMPERTGGKVYRKVINEADHSSLIHNVLHIDQVAIANLGLASTGLAMTTDATMVNAEDHGWPHTFRIKNTSTLSMTLEDLSLDHFGKSGVWFSTQYYDPNTPTGQFFPTDYKPWNRTLAPGEEVTLNFYRWAGSMSAFVWEVPADRQAGTDVMTVRAKIGSRVTSSKLEIQFRYNDILPKPALTRMPRGKGMPGISGLAH